MLEILSGPEKVRNSREAKTAYEGQAALLCSLPERLLPEMSVLASCIRPASPFGFFGVFKVLRARRLL